MDIGLCVLSHVGETEYFTLAEQLGYSHLWVADSQMIWSECFATLALAAVRTERINIGTGVAVAGTRVAPVVAQGIASINALAPGRTFLGIGSGNTAMRLMGHKPLRIAEFDEYLRVVTALLDGREVDFTWRGKTAPIRFLMEDLGFVATKPPIPIYVSGFGPKSQGLAGKWGDGLVVSVPPEPAFLQKALAAAERGALSAGRTFDPESFYVTTLSMAALQDEGEPLDSARIREEVGPFVLSSLHYLYEGVRQFGRQPPAHLRDIWPEYTRLVEETPESHRHQRIHAGHNTYMIEEEKQFVTEETIRATCLCGTASEIAEQLLRLERAGLRQVMLLPSLAPQESFLHRFAASVFPLLTRSA